MINVIATVVMRPLPIVVVLTVIGDMGIQKTQLAMTVAMGTITRMATLKEPTMMAHLAHHRKIL